MGQVRVRKLYFVNHRLIPVESFGPLSLSILKEALDRFIPVYGLAAHSLTSLSHFVCSAFLNIDLSSWHHLACLHMG
jgi:hypothetical protein